MKENGVSGRPSRVHNLDILAHHEVSQWGSLARFAREAVAVVIFFFRVQRLKEDLWIAGR